MPDTAGRLVPLSKYSLVHSSDVDEIREQVAAIFCPHRLQPGGRRGELAASLNSVTFDRISLTYLDYRAEVRITPSFLASFYLVQIPLRGLATISCGSERIESTPTLASVLSPTEPIDMWWEADNPQLIVRIDRAAIERELASLLGFHPVQPLSFAVGLDFTGDAGACFRRLVEQLRYEVDASSWLVGQPLALAPLESALMRALLLGHHSNYSDLLARHAAPALPRAVRRAVEYCQQHAAEPITLSELAEVAGVSVRSLQAGFARHLGLSPMAYLRDVRLCRAHDDLQRACPEDRVTVTDVAVRWGFWHPSRFAREYSRRFGEVPSATQCR